MNNQIIKEIKENRKTYREMIDFCCDSLILNNYIIEELSRKDFYFDTFCGSDVEYYDENGDEITEEQAREKEEQGEEVQEQYAEIYQYFLISERDAERLAEYTNELVLYNEILDIFILCVTHYGTAWDGVPANWKEEQDNGCENE